MSACDNIPCVLAPWAIASIERRIDCAHGAWFWLRLAPSIERPALETVPSIVIRGALEDLARGRLERLA